jgi:membrane protein DedA with SNARE-associated domain
MEQNIIYLFAASLCSALAAFFSIIGVSTPGWSSIGQRLFKCNHYCHESTTIGVLLIIAILLLVVTTLVCVAFARRFVTQPTNIMQSVLFLLPFIATIIIVVAYSRALAGDAGYSYQLTVISGVFAFLSTIFITYWVGRRSMIL